MNEFLKQIGFEIKAARQSQNLSINKAAQKLKIRKIYLSAIEKGDTQRFKIDTYMLGYIKNYTKFLNLDNHYYLESIRQYNTNQPSYILNEQKLITGKEFLPSKATLYMSALLIIVIYILMQFKDSILNFIGNY